MRCVSLLVSVLLVGCGGATLSSEPAAKQEVAADDGDYEAPEAAVIAPTPSAAPAEAAAAPPAAPVDEATDKFRVLNGEMVGTMGAREGGSGLGARGTGLGGGGGAGDGFGTLGSIGDGVGHGAGKAAPVGAPGMADVGRHAPARMMAPATPLRAGATDDNKDLPAFRKFLDEWGRDASVGAVYRPLYTLDVGMVRVVDADGSPVPGAVIQLKDIRGRVVQRATTYGDGRAPLYPRLGDAGGAWTVSVAAAGATAASQWAGGDATVSLNQVVSSPAAVPVDVAFILDTTGSMGDEIGRIQATLLQVVDALRQPEQPVDLRFGGVLYRDVGDDYVTRRMPFTGNLASFDAQLRAVEAGGGGDTPESLNQGLSEAVHALPWRDGAAHVAFLIADAEPHMDYEGDVLYTQSSLDAVGRGIRVHAVAASGLTPAGTVVFRQIAQATRGEFIFIEYGGDVAGSAAAHGVATPAQVASNNLDAILLQRIRAEVEGWRR
jgi:hypothetical protein